MLADRITVARGGHIDGYETMVQTYLCLIRELDEKYPDLRLRSLSPRNLVVRLADKPFGNQLGLLVRIHEKVRYAEIEPTEEGLYQYPHRDGRALI